MPRPYNLYLSEDDEPLFRALSKSHPELRPEDLIAKLVSRALRECWL